MGPGEGCTERRADGSAAATAGRASAPPPGEIDDVAAGTACVRVGKQCREGRPSSRIQYCPASARSVMARFAARREVIEAPGSSSSSRADRAGSASRACIVPDEYVEQPGPRASPDRARPWLGRSAGDPADQTGHRLIYPRAASGRRCPRAARRRPGAEPGRASRSHASVPRRVDFERRDERKIVGDLDVLRRERSAAPGAAATSARRRSVPPGPRVPGGGEDS